MEHTAESWGLPATVDYLWIIIVNDDLIGQNQVILKQGKNRYADKNKPLKFAIGRDLSKMRLYDCEASAQEDIIENKIEQSKEIDNSLRKFSR